MPESGAQPPPPMPAEPFFELSLDPLLTAGLDGYIKRANAAWERTLGWTEDELRAVPYVEFVHPDDRERTVREAASLASPGAEARDFEIRLRRRDGGYRVLHFSAIGTPEQGLIHAVAKDVTERKAAEAAAARAQERLEAVTDSVPDAIVSTDAASRIVFWSLGAERTFGFRPDEVLGDALTGLMPAASAERLRAALREPPTGPVQVACVRKDDRVFPAELTLGRVRGPEGETFTAVLRDVTAREHAEQQLAQRAAELEHSNQELERFAYVASHDLSEPLRMISGFTSLLQSRYGGRLDADADEFIRYIVDGADRMQELIRDLLTYSRAGREPPRTDAVDMGTLVVHVLEGLQTAIDESGARIEVAELPTVRGDASQLQQLVQNLVANALKFTPDAPPVVRISAAREDADWCFAVADEGIGIDPQGGERIFQVFQRLHRPEDYPGTGIGLAICRTIVERHGGRIWVEPGEPRGSVFRFTLPAMQETAGHDG